ERDIQGRAPGIGPGFGEGADLGVRAAEFLVIPLTEQESLVVDDDGAHGRIGLDAADAKGGKRKGLPHRVFGRGELHGRLTNDLLHFAARLFGPGVDSVRCPADRVSYWRPASPKLQFAAAVVSTSAASLRTTQ